MHLVVLAAGLGTRFGGVKQLAAVGPHGEAIMDVLIRRAAASGFDGGVVVVRAEIEERVRAHLDAHRPLLPCDIVRQPVPHGRERPLGTADAVLVGRDAVDGPFAVVNADDLYPASAFDSLAAHLYRSEHHALVAFRLARTVIGDRPVSRAMVTFDDEHRLTSIVENRTLEPAGSNGAAWVSMNMWGFQPSIFDVLGPAVEALPAADRDSEVLLPDVVASMVAGGAFVRVLTSEDPCIGVTYADDVDAVRRALA